jgi:hypothetical protein
LRHRGVIDTGGLERIIEVTDRRLSFSDAYGMVLSDLSEVAFEDHSCNGPGRSIVGLREVRSSFKFGILKLG